MNKNELLDHIVDFYLTSGDFNGTPIYRLQNYNPEDIWDNPAVPKYEPTRNTYASHTVAEQDAQ